MSWEENWREVDVETAIRKAQDDFLSPYFKRYLSRSGVNYEGGCGWGKYLVHYRRLGYRFLGADFAREALGRVRKLDPEAELHAADVGRLPLRDASVDFYYSGGVVEHFEEGPQRALREAHRVLKPDGHLLITVPFVNAIRKLTLGSNEPTQNWEGHWFRRVPDFHVEEPPQGTRFMEYRFERAEFRETLEHHGFEVLTLRPYSLIAGEFGSLLARTGRDTSQQDEGERTRPAGATSKRNGGRFSGLRQYALDVLSTEKPSGLPFRPAVRALNNISGHMLMAVCRPADPAGTADR